MGSMFLSAQEIRDQFQSVVTDVSEAGKACFITENGRARAVIVDIDRYNAMLDFLEDQDENDDWGGDLLQSVISKSQES